MDPFRGRKSLHSKRFQRSTAAKNPRQAALKLAMLAACSQESGVQVADVTRPLRGFARLSPERRREIASKGGSSVEPQERAFSRDPALAARAGRIGGEVRSRPPSAEEPLSETEGGLVPSAEE